MKSTTYEVFGTMFQGREIAVRRVFRTEAMAFAYVASLAACEDVDVSVYERCLLREAREGGSYEPRLVGGAL